ncbi:MAG: beta-lactamase family protein [Gammaproteobacteria bacterium]|nr:beta-lactamase family protein [Gammaproteobacteria bacterium]
MTRPVMLLGLVLALASAGNVIGDEENREGSMTTTPELPRATPEDAGMSGERRNRGRDVVQGFIDEGRIQYAVVGVARRGKVVYFEAQGVSNDEPVQKDAMFHMASSTKPILGVAAMMVIEEGLVSPSDPVEKYIPEFKGIKVAVFDEKADEKTTAKKGFEKAPRYRLVDADRPVTIHDLLTHTSGISGRAPGRTREIQHEGDTLATWIPVVAEGPLSFQPGTRWGYGGGLDVVARVIEIVSGMPFNEFVQERIFDPLDMKDTHWIVPEDKLHRMLIFVEGKAGTPTTYFSGSAGLVSTARDYLHFEQMLVNKGELFGNRLLKPESVEMMSTDQAGDLYANASKGGAGVAFGYTVGITVDPELAKTGRSAGAFGWGGAAGTVSWTDPEERLAVSIMVQQPTQGLGVRIAETIAAAIDD